MSQEPEFSLPKALDVYSTADLQAMLLIGGQQDTGAAGVPARPNIPDVLLSNEQLITMIKTGCVMNFSEHGIAAKGNFGVLKAVEGAAMAARPELSEAAEEYTRMASVRLSESYVTGSLPAEYQNDIGIYFQYRGRNVDGVNPAGFQAVVVMDRGDAIIFEETVKKSPQMVYRLLTVLNGGPLTRFDGQPLDIQPGRVVEIFPAGAGAKVESRPFPEGYNPNPKEEGGPAETVPPTAGVKSMILQLAAKEGISAEEVYRRYMPATPPPTEQVAQATLEAKPFGYFLDADPTQVSNFLKNEDPQTIANILITLGAEESAGILRHFEPELLDELTRYITATRAVTPATVEQLDKLLGPKFTAAMAPQPTEQGDREIDYAKEVDEIEAQVKGVSIGGKFPPVVIVKGRESHHKLTDEFGDFGDDMGGYTFGSVDLGKSLPSALVEVAIRQYEKRRGGDLTNKHFLIASRIPNTNEAILTYSIPVHWSDSGGRPVGRDTINFRMPAVSTTLKLLDLVRKNPDVAEMFLQKAATGFESKPEDFTDGRATAGIPRIQSDEVVIVNMNKFNPNYFRSINDDNFSGIFNDILSNQNGVIERYKYSRPYGIVDESGKPVQQIPEPAADTAAENTQEIGPLKAVELASIAELTLQRDISPEEAFYLLYPEKRFRHGTFDFQVSKFSTFAALNDYREGLAAIPGVTDVKIRRVHQGTLFLSVDYDDQTSLIEKLREMKDKPKNITLNGTTAQIELEVPEI